VVDAVAEGDVKGSSIGGRVSRDSRGGLQHGQRDELAPRDGSGLRIQRKNGTAPLLTESSGELRSAQVGGLAEPVAEFAVAGFALKSDGFAQLGVGDDTTIHKKQADGKAMSAWLFLVDRGKQSLNAGGGEQPRGSRGCNTSGHQDPCHPIWRASMAIILWL